LRDPDEVLDGGTFLRVSYGSETEDIPLSNVKAAETSKFVTALRVELLLRTSSKFGDVISFYPHRTKDASGRECSRGELEKQSRPHGSMKPEFPSVACLSPQPLAGV
jgi:hypothetical protein